MFHIVADDVAILTILPSTKTIHFHMLNDVFFALDKNVTIPGFIAVTIGVFHGNTFSSPISVGNVISWISHSNITLSGVDILSCMLFS
jgi:uncharacterized oligopeptide transporter (OPT) family protein